MVPVMATTEHPSEPAGRLHRLYRRLEGAPAESSVTAVLVAVCVGFVFWHLEPELLLRDSTPAGGDMGAHVWAPDYLRDHLLSQGRLSGWTPDWYAGFPAYHFYMVVPSLFILALDLVMPYNVAFKLVSVSGLVTMPVAAWALGRLARLPFPGPPLLAVASVVFLFDRSFSIYGGNIASTLAGEFAFSISLTLSLVFLGVVLRGLETGRHRALAAVLLALTALCHVIPAIFAVVAGLVAMAYFALVGLRHGEVATSGRRLWWAVSAGVVGGLLTTFWTLPFVLRRAYLNDMGWERITIFWERLIPGPVGRAISSLFGGAADNGGAGTIEGDLSVAFVLALVGVGASIAFRRRLGIFLTVVAVVAAVGYVLAPQGRLWNARLLPFWYLCVYLLAAIAIAELVRALAKLSQDGDHEGARRWTLRGTAVAGALVLATVAFPMRSLPFGTVDEAGDYHWPTKAVGFTNAAGDQSFISGWAQWNYTGYEGKAAYPEYREVVEMMAAVGDEHGCGRAMWEYDRTLDRFGTPMALMLLPYWTDGCIGSMEGLYFEASATTPYHFMNQSALSASPSQAQRNLPYSGLSVPRGVEYLQMMGVRYYMAFSAAAVAQADQHPDLTPLAASQTYPVSDPEGVVTDTTWRVYEVADTELVAPLSARPAVWTDVPDGGEGWLEAAVEWYREATEDDVFRAADGPAEWERVSHLEDPERVPLDPVDVSNVVEGNDSVSFEVSEPGTPMLVKVSYFPNWEVSGAEGPWRVAPNLMVVVPTETRVELSYGTTGVEWLSWALTLLGLVGLVVLARRGDVDLREGEGAVADPDADPDAGEAVPEDATGPADGHDPVLAGSVGSGFADGTPDEGRDDLP
jgi:hypothetical protein